LGAVMFSPDTALTSLLLPFLPPGIANPTDFISKIDDFQGRVQPGIRVIQNESLNSVSGACCHTQ
jgi:hypothetical protein